MYSKNAIRALSLLGMIFIMGNVCYSQISRAQMISNAQPYTTYSWTATSSNIWNGVTCGGKTIQTPSWVQIGTNTAMPYCWGGWTSTATIQGYLNSGKSAGDDNTATSFGAEPACAVGLDCSGLVSRSWGLSSKYSTTTLPNISTATTLTQTQPGDILNLAGSHTRLIETNYGNGSYQVMESSAVDWRSSHRTYTANNLSGYDPRYYNNITTTCSAPSNNSCYSPSTLSIGSSCSYTSGDLCGATQSVTPSTCSGYTAASALDVWYTVTPSTTSNVIIRCQSGASTDIVLGLYSGACPNFTLIQCSDGTTSGGLETISATLSAGVTYFIRVYDFNANANGTDFQICVSAPSSCTDQFESNNSSSAATNVFQNPLNTGSSNYTLQANMGYAGDQDWYKVNIGTCGTLTINLSNLPYNYDLELYGPTGLSQFISGSYNLGTTGEQVVYTFNGPTTTVYAKVYANNSNDYTTASCYNLQFIWTPATCACTAPSAPTASSPGTASAQGPTVLTTPTLAWGTVTGASGYDPRISQCPFGNPNIIWNHSCATGNSIAVSPSLPTGNLYRWNLDATCDCAGTISSSSNTLYFNIPPVITYNGSTTICSGGSLTLNTSAGNTVSTPTYQWYMNGSSVGSNSSSYSATQAGLYTVAINYSCGTTDQSSAVTITTSPLPSQPGSISGQNNVCSGSTINYTVPNSSGVTYSWTLPSGWSGSSTSNTITTTAGSTGGTISVVAVNSCGPSATASVMTVTVNSPPSVTASGPPASVCPNQQVTFTAGGATSYSWSGPGVSGSSSSANATYASSGTYTVTVTGNPGACSASATASVIVDAPPPIAASVSTSPVCMNQQVSFIATGGNTYAWSGNGVTGQSSSTTSASYSTSGIYTVTVTGYSRNNCSASIPISVTVNPNVVPMVSISPRPISSFCSGNNSIAFTASGSNGGNNPQYQWSTSNGLNGTGTSFAITNLSSNITLSCTLTSNAQCVSPSTATDTVSVHIAPPVTPIINITSSASTLCINSSVTFAATITNGPSGSQPSSITWYVDGSPSGNGSTYTYGGWGSAGTHSVYCTVDYPNTACVTQTTFNSATTLTINVQTQAPAGISISTNHTTICQNSIDSFTAFASNGGSSPTYQWTVNNSSVGTNSFIFASSTLNNNDVLRCFLTSNSSCAVPDTSSSNSIALTVNPNPIPLVSNDTAACAGTPIALLGSGGASCSWTPSIGLSDSASCTPVCTTSVPRTYTLTVENTYGCKATAQVSINIVSPANANANDSIRSITPGGSGFIACLKNTSSNSTSVKWDFGDGQASTTESPCHSFSSCGPYIVTLTAYNSCGASADSNSIQFVLNCPLGIAENSVLSNVKIVPNPSSGRFTLMLELQDNKDVDLKVLDMIGQVIWNERMTGATGKIEKKIDLNDKANGIYILQLNLGGNIFSYKLEVYR